MVVLLTRVAVEKATTGFLDSEPAFRLLRWGRRGDLGRPRCHRLSWVHRPRRSGARGRGPSRRQAQGWCGPQAQPRTRPCAPWRHTAAGYSRGQGDEVRKGGSTGDGRYVGADTTQAKRAGPDLGAGPKAAPAQPGRRHCRGAKRSAAGIARRAFPWSASAARSAEGAKASTSDAAKRKGIRIL